MYVHVAVVGLGRGREGGGAQFTELESSWTRCLHICVHVCSMNTRRGLTR